MRTVTIPLEDPAIGTALTALKDRIAQWSTGAMRLTESLTSKAHEQAAQAQHIIEWEQYLRELQASLEGGAATAAPESASESDSTGAVEEGCASQDEPAEVADAAAEQSDAHGRASANTAPSADRGPSAIEANPFADDLTGPILPTQQEEVASESPTTAELDEAALADVEPEVAQAVRVLRRLRGARAKIEDLIEQARSQRRGSQQQGKKRSWWSKG